MMTFDEYVTPDPSQEPRLYPHFTQKPKPIVNSRSMRQQITSSVPDFKLLNVRDVAAARTRLARGRKIIWIKEHRPSIPVAPNARGFDPENLSVSRNTLARQGQEIGRSQRYGRRDELSETMVSLRTNSNDLVVEDSDQGETIL